MSAEAIALAAGLCRRFEGLRLSSYLCPSGLPTVGYGATFYESGARVTMNDPPITAARADVLLAFQLERVFLPQVLKLCPGAQTPGQVAALLDFTFNCGAGNLKMSSLRRRVNAQQWDQVPAEFRKWNRGGGRVLRGLTLRREAEINLL